LKDVPRLRDKASNPCQRFAEPALRISFAFPEILARHKVIAKAVGLRNNLSLRMARPSRSFVTGAFFPKKYFCAVFAIFTHNRNKTERNRP
jgi:hypothetical protein